MMGEEAAREKLLKQIFRGAQRYHFASVQDKNLIVAARHNGYAVALIDALHSDSDEAEIKRITGYSLKKIRREILDIQDKTEEMAFKFLEQMKAKGLKLPT